MDRYFGCFGLPGTFVLTACMSLLALVLAMIFPAPARWLCFAAMLLSSFGDICNTRFMGIDRILPNYFYVGAGFFMAAHLFYAAAYLMKIRGSGAVLLNPGAMIMMGIAVALAVGFAVMCRREGRLNMLPLILIYIALISLDCTMIFSFAWSQGLANPLALLAAAGAVSFFLSDLIIGLDVVFGGGKFGWLIWWLYPIGQILMILGVGRG
ncbi:MAG: hypothetical protein IKV90_10135 [Clostridia bacterium]|nr:hypothetical protein [Clostridia bacterium]